MVEIYSRSPVSVSGLSFTVRPTEVKELTSDIENAIIRGWIIIAGTEGMEIPDLLAVIEMIKSGDYDPSLLTSMESTELDDGDELEDELDEEDEEDEEEIL